MDKTLHVVMKAIEQEASDIHFIPENHQAAIYFRVLGKRVLYEKINLDLYMKILAYFKFNAGMDIGETRKPQDGAITHINRDELYSLRLSTLPLKQSESLAIRILPQTQAVPLSSLFLFPFQQKIIQSWLKNKSGIILFCGPTGSGKTTAMYAILQTLLKEGAYQAITLEDPIEKKLDNLLQVQVNEKAGLTYQAGLKGALRHDPDILMVGEIRDEMTAQFAFETARTGHLVLSTLHAADAPGALHRLLEMGIKHIDLQQILLAAAAMELLTYQLPNHILGRAAILELLDKQQIKEVLNKKKLTRFTTFDQLRRKAYACGYLTEEAYMGS